MFEFPPETEIRTWGLEGPEAAADARKLALEYGIRMAALCGNIWPANDDGLFALVARQLISEFVPFAINARRYMELTGNKQGVKSDGPLVRVKQGAPYELDVWTALNRAVHASSLRVEYVTPEARKHTNLGDLVVASLIAVSPERAEVRICPQGLFFGLMENFLPNNRLNPPAKPKIEV